MLIWIIDEEWDNYDLEKEVLNKVFPNVEIKISTYDYEKDLKEFGYKADGILAQVYADIPKSLINKLENCKGIAVYGGGYDRVDIEACKLKNIPVTNIQGYCAEDLADYVLAAMYHINKKICFYSNNIKKDVIDKKWGAMTVRNNTNRLSQQTLFIVGFGTIGKVLAQKARKLDIKVIAYDEFLSEEEICKFDVKKVGWEEGFEVADYVSVNLKGCDENEDKIGMNEFKIMKKSAYIINTARGKIIKEEELIDAVESCQIQGAILDVIKNESAKPDDPIINCKNIIVTPHISYISVESFIALKDFALENLISMIKGEKPRDPVY